jgi:CDP-glycerol glycerophosphotransferase (TagB/SpsB family)
MKIDRSNPRHWLYLLLFGAQVLLAMAGRLLRSRRGRWTVVFYGHRLNGNLSAVWDELAKPSRRARFEPVFLTMDPAYHRELQEAGLPCVLATSMQCSLLLARTAAIITSHGLHSMQPLVRFSDIRFFDVWHGIPFKGFDADDFRVQHRYDEIWVASPLHRQLYIDRYGFEPDKVVATGYPRTDRLVRRDEDVQALKRRFGVPSNGKLVLFAPTWAQDAQGRSIYPFEKDESEFLGALSVLAERTDATILMRAHLNSGTGAGRGYPRVIPVPHGSHPDTEGILLVSDVLICDWSSIAFDYLLLDRPTLFLDVPPPFRKGFSLGPEFRFGPVVTKIEELVAALEGALRNLKEYESTFSPIRQEIRSRVYGRFADGSAAERCGDRAEQIFSRPKRQRD